MRERRDAVRREKNEALSSPRVAFSRVGWFSRALAFRSFYYPWGQMGTTRSLKKKQENAYILSPDSSQELRAKTSSQAGIREAWFIIPFQKFLLHWKWPCQKFVARINQESAKKWKESGLLNEVSCLIQGSKINDFCLKQGQCLQASEPGAPLPKLHLTAPPPPFPGSCPPSHPRSKRHIEIRWREHMIAGYS